MLLANKIDLVGADGWGKTKEDLEAFCKEQGPSLPSPLLSPSPSPPPGFVAVFETSAKDDISIDSAANKLVATILEQVPSLPPLSSSSPSPLQVQPVPQEEDPATLKLGGEQPKKDDDCAC